MYLDQRRRSQIIASIIEREKIKNFYTMDGHGRFITTFIMTLNEKKFEEKLKIHLCDIDKATTDFH